MYSIIALLIAFISPLVLLPIEQMLPYTFIIEELVKLFLVILIILEGKKCKKSFWGIIFLIGFLFTISESILYLVNIIPTGNYSLFPLRIILTGSLHSGTTLLMYGLGKKSIVLLIIGFILAVLIHYFFNLWVVGL